MAFLKFISIGPAAHRGIPGFLAGQNKYPEVFAQRASSVSRGRDRTVALAKAGEFRPAFPVLPHPAEIPHFSGTNSVVVENLSGDPDRRLLRERWGW